ncbi:unnamed protein product [Cyprideis torosa]|uniref:Uncharacterized protein n=1 Tax=Cyprideis torosa TaxID=163714 RepID=A0A7R8WPU5_9CRUS|nr:unnamed protein product [Cyprideis torosa]CAG0907499.1 unnamed protein product [Cyprideis torosa]
MTSRKLKIAANAMRGNQIHSVSSDSNEPEWHDSEKNREEFWDKFELFLAYKELNMTTRFIMVENCIESNSSPVRTSVQIKCITKSINFPSVPGRTLRVPGIEPGTSSINIEWAQPETGAENVTSYVISYHEVSNENEIVKVEVPKCLQTTVENLHPATAYCFQIQCKSIAGLSPPGEKSDAIWTADDPHKGFMESTPLNPIAFRRSSPAPTVEPRTRIAGAAATTSHEELEGMEGIPCEFCGTKFNDLNALLNHERRCFNDEEEARRLQEEELRRLQEELNQEEEERERQVKLTSDPS